jgi:hypothetical protein
MPHLTHDLNAACWVIALVGALFVAHCLNPSGSKRHW